MAIITGDCRRITCPPERPNKQIINGQCYCTESVRGGGVERLTGRYSTAANAPVGYQYGRAIPVPQMAMPAAWPPPDLGVGMAGCPSCGMDGLGSLDSTLAMVINLAVLGLAGYGAYHLFIK